MEVIFVDVVLAVELDKEVVEKAPAKYMLLPFEDILSTGPFRPPKSTAAHEEEAIDHRPILPPLPEGALNDPPTQTSPRVLSQYKSLTGPESPGETA